MCLIPRCNSRPNKNRGYRNTLSDEDRHKLVESHVAMVKWVLGKLIRQGKIEKYLQEDALSEGYLGLVRASQSYNPELSSFTTYASQAVAWYILNWRNRQMDKHGKEVPASCYHKPDALDDNFFESHGFSYEDRGEAVEDSDLKAHLLKQLPQLLNTLHPNDRKTLELLYLEGRTPQEVSDELGLCRQRIYQLRDRAISRLFKFAREKGLR